MVILTTLTLKSCIWTPNFVDITMTEYVSCTQSIKVEPDQFVFGLDKDPACWLSALKLTIFWISILHRHMPNLLKNITIFAVPIIGFLTCSHNHHQVPDRVSLILTLYVAATITAASIVHAIFLILGLEHLSDLITAIEVAFSLKVADIR
ncbi:hypothetical protein IW262DRAFT_1297692 [Armillaria fumosa]|nr:hypothetical protein IW262DRAFT_1302858 [Armillaria fumosa]KAK0220641.1 hypothetical protein IW262DRAFT_1297692 [Armillaria fumosa]